MNEDRFSASPGEYRVYRAESEVFVGSRSSVARIMNRTEWFDRRGQVTGSEETEWVGPLTSLIDTAPAEGSRKTQSSQPSRKRLRFRRSRVDRIADIVVIFAVLAAAAFLFFSLR